MGEGKIDNPRSEIDAIDEELLRLLNKRAEIALRVGAAKTNVETSLCDPTRELEVLARMRAENPGPFAEHNIDSIFQRIIDESLQLQQDRFGRKLSDQQRTEQLAAKVGGRSRVAFLGERGTFSEEAALSLLGDESETVSMPTFDELFLAIESGKADYILTPLENSLIGSVHRCVDLLLRSSLHIVAELVLPVSHYLVACEGATIETVRTVESHPAALAQCTAFFAAHPEFKRVPADDTAGSVRRAVESGDITRAGIGGKRTAEIYGGKILLEHLEDNRENYTRFALLSAVADRSETGTKISLVMRLKNRPGSLHGALRPFVRRGVDLLKIESLPIRDSPDEYNFYLDVLVPANPGEMSGALDEVRELAVDVRVLGRYSSTILGSA
ncbi:MAG TPA: prephenate dehydratase domain-containing protein [Pyrinomonadaceae bacterium]|nr:chorismate mutase [Chloracidobacterium sp.]MBP9937003.1 chorismate mutase [Pyrinomonadaceae bacterium]MBK7802139.1 chorismate mutase [Chloracidobacterium sp.]MBK9437715.1 chorismate mutase [Chloracidobacterium sp.]MBL0239686.1 chorismate mutase [Chloracidobacterium sp.]